MVFCGGIEDLWFELLGKSPNCGARYFKYSIKRSGGRDYARLLPDMDAVVLYCLSSA